MIEVRVSWLATGQRALGLLFISVGLILILASCNSTPNVSEDQQRQLSTQTLDYERCVNDRVTKLSGAMRAVEALSRAVQQACRLERERVKDALSDYESDYQKEYLESLDLLTREMVRRSLYQAR